MKTMRETRVRKILAENLTEILNMYINGKSVRTIAIKYNVNHVSVWVLVKKHVDIKRVLK